jgi:hypothetical protein
MQSPPLMDEPNTTASSQKVCELHQQEFKHHLLPIHFSISHTTFMNA